jgi:dihydrofolate reductase
MQIVSIMTAMDKKRAIGKGSGLPWPSLPADMAYFEAVTLGHAIIMGRRTFETIGSKPLPGRSNIVISRQTDYKADGCEVAQSLEDALALAGDGEVFIVGGAEIYRQALHSDLVNRMYVTRVEGEFLADTFFPEFDISLWTKVKSTPHTRDDKNPYDFTFVVLEKVSW